MTAISDFECAIIDGKESTVRNYEGMIPDYLIVDEKSYPLADKLFRASKTAGFGFSYKCKITDCVFIAFDDMKECLKIIKYCTNEEIHTIKIQTHNKLI